MNKKFVYAIGLLLTLVIAFTGFCKVFSFKFRDGIYQLTSFYELEEDSVDVVVLGSSHSFVDINPMVLWEENGITAFDLCGSVAPLWNSYHYLVEALKTQSPKLVILDSYCLLFDIQYIDDSRIIKNVFGLKPSQNKLDSLKVSAPPDRWVEFGVEFIQYSKRYKDISAEDFAPYLNNAPLYSSWKGFANDFTQVPTEQPKVINDGTRADLPRKQQEYYEKIINLCKEEGIELLVVATPYPSYADKDMAIFNSAKDIADAAGVPFVNFNEYYDEININWSTDFVDNSHLNYLGSTKFTRYLADYLKENYNFEPHDKTDPKVKSWNESLRYFKRSIVNKELSEVLDLNEYTDKLYQLQQDNYTIIVAVRSAVPEGKSNAVYGGARNTKCKF